MEEKIQKEDGISLMDILHLLLSKIKLLILVVILGGVLGGSFAVWRTIDVNYYGTEVQFYVNPDRPKTTASSEGSQYGVYGAYGRHVMDNMVKLLSSESFTEQLILNGKLVPEASVAERPWEITVKDATTQEEVDAANAEFNANLNTAIYDATLLLAEADKARTDVADAKKTANEALEKVQDAWEAIVPSLPDVSNSYWSYSDIAYTHLQTKLPAELKALCEDYHTKKQQAENLQDQADLAVEIAEEKTEYTLQLWRQTKQYKSQLNAYSGQISYSYLEESADADDANNLARSFIYVKISVLNNQSFAEELYERVIKVVPEYVEANMAVPSDYEGTNCRRISRTDEIRLTNVRYTTNQAIKYALLFAVAAAVVAAVVIIIVDRSDKRLRDQETITRLFNVPVLGIVPTIDDLTELSAVKMKERAKRKTVEKKEKAKAERQEKTAKAKAEKPVKVKKEKPVKVKKEKPVKVKKEKPETEIAATEAPAEKPQNKVAAQTSAPVKKQQTNNNGKKKKKGNRR